MKEWVRGVDPKLARRWAAIGVAGIILILLASIFTSGSQAGTPGPTGAPTPPPASETSQDAVLAYEKSLDSEVAEALSRVSGAGMVEVSITLAGSPARRFAENTTTQRGMTTQRDAQGGIQTQKSVQTSTSLASGAGASPVLTEEVGPAVVGVLVVASGARDPLVRDDLFQAATTLLGVPGYKVMVLP